MIQLLAVQDENQQKINEEISQFLSSFNSRLDIIENNIINIEDKLIELEARIEALENP